MTAVHLSQVARQLRGMLAARESAGLTEADLWERYVRERDEVAFEMLVRRHSPMVLGVCRRILRNEQDAEDAFQATFLVLVRRAASLRSPRTIANWLHGVARRTALEARTAAAKRRAKEAAVLPRMMMPDDAGDDIRPVLDQELGQLTENYRTAVVPEIHAAMVTITTINQKSTPKSLTAQYNGTGAGNNQTDAG
jgi:RNA polymerase sigma factor (sigma-70 family)